MLPGTEYVWSSDSVMLIAAFKDFVCLHCLSLAVFNSHRYDFVSISDFVSFTFFFNHLFSLNYQTYAHSLRQTHDVCPRGTSDPLTEGKHIQKQLEQTATGVSIMGD